MPSDVRKMNNRFPHRLSTGFDKKLFGVPVFPGPSIGPIHHSAHVSSSSYPQESDHYGPQTVDDHMNNLNNNLGSSTHWKLRHVDFMPAQVKSKKDEDYEKFT